MSGSIIIGIIILAILATSILCTPHLLFGLDVKDGWRSLCDSKYLLFLFAHRRFSKVKAGKQTYERYCNDIRSIFNENGFNKSKSAIENNKRIHDRAILSEMLSDQNFIGHHFESATLNYTTFIQMNEEWDLRPIIIPATTENVDSCEEVPSACTEETVLTSPKIKNGLSEKERKAEGSFRQLILDKDKEEGIISYLCSKLKTMSKGMEYAALVLALKQFDGVHYHSNRELMDCINSTFNPGIRITYTALSSQLKNYEELRAFSEREAEMRSLIDTILTELRSI